MKSNKEEKLTEEELREVVKRNVDYLLRDIDNVLWNMRQNVFNQIKYYDLNYKEEVFRTIVNLIIEEVIIYLVDGFYESKEVWRLTKNN